jgi:hypothetical protein
MHICFGVDSSAAFQSFQNEHVDLKRKKKSETHLLHMSSSCWLANRAFIADIFCAL